LESELARREAHVIAREPDRSAFFASAEDTLLAKLDWYRASGEVSEQQWRDVVGILEVQANRLDLRYLRSMAATLQVNELLERVLTESSAPPHRGPMS
jgi:hypothetical protein